MKLFNFLKDLVVDIGLKAVSNVKLLGIGAAVGVVLLLAVYAFILTSRADKLTLRVEELKGSISELESALELSEQTNVSLREYYEEELIAAADARDVKLQELDGYNRSLVEKYNRDIRECKKEVKVVVDGSCKVDLKEPGGDDLLYSDFLRLWQ
jgi:hypothetical protein